MLNVKQIDGKKHKKIDGKKHKINQYKYINQIKFIYQILHNII
jgi:hypothetical protein